MPSTSLDFCNPACWREPAPNLHLPDSAQRVFQRGLLTATTRETLPANLAILRDGPRLLTCDQELGSPLSLAGPCHIRQRDSGGFPREEGAVKSTRTAEPNNRMSSHVNPHSSALTLPRSR